MELKKSKIVVYSKKKKKVWNPPSLMCWISQQYKVFSYNVSSLYDLQINDIFQIDFKLNFWHFTDNFAKIDALSS